VHEFNPRTIAADADIVREHLRRRNAAAPQFDAVDRLVELHSVRVDLLSKGDIARAARKKLSGTIHQLMKSGQEDEAENVKRQVADAAKDADAADEELAAVERERQSLLMGLPNFLDSRVPDGKDESDNQVLYEWWPEQQGSVGSARKEGKWHDELASSLYGGHATADEGPSKPTGAAMLSEEATSISGARFSVLQGDLARMERALLNFFVDLHVDQHGYTELSVPLLVGATALQGTGQLPKFADDLFTISQESFKVSAVSSAVSSAVGEWAPSAVSSAVGEWAPSAVSSAVGEWAPSVASADSVLDPCIAYRSVLGLTWPDLL
jgi:seryl-tRNA synthetase